MDNNRNISLSKEQEDSIRNELKNIIERNGIDQEAILSIIEKMIEEKLVREKREISNFFYRNLFKKLNEKPENWSNIIEGFTNDFKEKFKKENVFETIDNAILFDFNDGYDEKDLKVTGLAFLSLAKTKASLKKGFLQEVERLYRKEFEENKKKELLDGEIFKESLDNNNCNVSHNVLMVVAEEFEQNGTINSKHWIVVKELVSNYPSLWSKKNNWGLKPEDIIKEKGLILREETSSLIELTEIVDTSN